MRKQKQFLRNETIYKLIPRSNYNQKRANNQRRRVRSGIKNIEGRIRNRDIKIKQIIPHLEKLKLKKMSKLLDE